MPVSLLIGLLVPTLGALAYSAAVYRDLHRIEGAQIAVDNAAIALGRADRALARRVERANALLSKWELSHHPAHVCARVPSEAQPECKAIDLAIETRMRVLVAAVSADLAASWRAHLARARVELGRGGFAGLVVGRPEAAPFTTRICPVCREIVRWSAPPGHQTLGTLSLAVSGTRRTAVVLGRERVSSWSYRLRCAGAMR